MSLLLLLVCGSCTPTCWNEENIFVLTGLVLIDFFVIIPTPPPLSLSGSLRITWFILYPCSLSVAVVLFPCEVSQVSGMIATSVSPSVNTEIRSSILLFREPTFHTHNFKGNRFRLFCLLEFASLNHWFSFSSLQHGMKHSLCHRHSDSLMNDHFLHSLCTS